MLMMRRFGQPMADFVRASENESVMLSCIKAVIREMIKFEPKERYTLSDVRESLEALKGRNIS